MFTNSKRVEWTNTSSRPNLRSNLRKKEGITRALHTQHESQAATITHLFYAAEAVAERGVHKLLVLLARVERVAADHAHARHDVILDQSSKGFTANRNVPASMAMGGAE